MSTPARPKRKRFNKKQHLTDEQWVDVIKKYTEEKHSITTLASIYNIGHEYLRKGLIARGFEIERRNIGSFMEKRLEVIPKGRFADNPFYKH
jgi:hypothetical protein